MAKQRRNVIIPHDSTYDNDGQEVNITSIRIARDDETKKFEVSFLSGTNFIKTFKASKLTFQVISYDGTKIDALEITQSNTKKHVININSEYSTEVFNNYISALII